MSSKRNQFYPQPLLSSPNSSLMHHRAYMEIHATIEPTVLDNFVNSLFGPTVAGSDSFWNRRIQEVTRDAQRPNMASPGPARIPTFLNPAWLLPPPPQPPMTGGKGDCTPLFRNRKKLRAFSLHRDLPGGVRSMTAPRMEHGPVPSCQLHVSAL